MAVEQPSARDARYTDHCDRCRREGGPLYQVPRANGAPTYVCKACLKAQRHPARPGQK